MVRVNHEWLIELGLGEYEIEEERHDETLECLGCRKRMPMTFRAMLSHARECRFRSSFGGF